MSALIGFLPTFIIQLIQSSSYIGIFILMTLESGLIPLPSEITMPFSGYLVQKGQLSFVGVVLAGTLGNLVGSLLAYGLGYLLGETVIVSIIKRYGKLLLITLDEYERSMRWLRKYGDSVTFFSRLMPAVRTFISLPAGLSKMNVWKFSLYTTLGSLIWSAFLTYVGYYLGSEWHSLEPYYRKFEIVIGLVFIAAVAWYVNHKLKIVKLPH